MADTKEILVKLFTIILVFIVVAGLGYGGYRGYQYYLFVEDLKGVKNNLFLAKIDLEKKIGQFELNILQLSAENTNLTNSLIEERNRNNEFEAQIQSIQGTVDIVQKLQNTDKELLQKYSKVYFLNENYVPESLVAIDSKYLQDKDEPEQIHASVQRFLYGLLDDAVANGTPLEIISAYRSFKEQASLKIGYKIIYGSGANKFSADQGYSEHQLGTTVDFITPDIGAGFSKFETTTAYTWLTDNAYKYGFALSYPKNNAYYQFEPWHWRFIGVELAQKLHSVNLYFYDLDQRLIDTYLVSIFD